MLDNPLVYKVKVLTTDYASFKVMAKYHKSDWQLVSETIASGISPNK